MSDYLPFSRHHRPGFLLASLGCVLLISACGGGSTRPQTPVPTPGATPSGAGLIVFAMAPEGADAAQTDIYSLAPDGSNLRRLTTSAPDSAGNVQPQGSPALSPDRRRIVWVSVAFQNGQSESQLRIMNADGSGARLLSGDSNTRGATVPTWSPNGNRIAFSRGNAGIWTLNADGTGARQLTDQGANPSWSRTGRIAFNAAPGVRAVASQSAARQVKGVLPPTTNSYTDIWTIGADGGALQQLTQRSQTAAGLAAINPAWSPDGQTLVFNSVPGSGVPAQLFLVNADGNNRRLLGEVNGTDAVFSPDGNRIAYSDETGLATVNLGGTGRVILGAANGLFVEDTDWR